MKKAELIAAVVEKTGLTKKDAEKAVNAVLDTVVATVAAGDKATETKLRKLLQTIKIKEISTRSAAMVNNFRNELNKF